MEAVDYILSKMREPSCFKGKIHVEREAVGNAAKMREALEWCRDFMRDIYDGKEGVKFSAYDIERIDSALSAPPRNCDKFSKAEVLEMLDDCSFSKEDTIEWLYAEAKGEVEK